MPQRVVTLKHICNLVQATNDTRKTIVGIYLSKKIILLGKLSYIQNGFLSALHCKSFVILRKDFALVRSCNTLCTAPVP